MSASDQPDVEKPRGGCSLKWYLLLFGLQLAGALTCLFCLLPVHRVVMRDLSKQGCDPTAAWYQLAVIVLIQTGYWLRVRLNPAMPRWRNIVASHLSTFCSRLSFVLVSTVFSFYMVNNFDKVQVPFFRVVLTLATLFSMFCWSLELEHLGRSLKAPDTKAN